MTTTDVPTPDTLDYLYILIEERHIVVSECCEKVKPVFIVRLANSDRNCAKELQRFDTCRAARKFARSLSEMFHGRYYSPKTDIMIKEYRHNSHTPIYVKP